ncbi:MAG: PQQ-dependent sugar dehydrogenase [Anaerolineae bacterium]|nr:MAG: PQQ-dependent sugar dehydrogenase [Anaerolineae bacterium]
MPCVTYATVGPPDGRLYACGLRNPFDFTFDSVTGYLFATENGPGCNDEVNLVLSGANYGWPYSAAGYYDCQSLPAPYTEPIYVYPGPSQSPASSCSTVTHCRSGAITSCGAPIGRTPSIMRHLPPRLSIHWRQDRPCRWRASRVQPIYHWGRMAGFTCLVSVSCAS